MSDDPKCTEIGCMTPAQVVKCCEESTTECWVAATVIAEDGSEVSYECCGGGGSKARFRLLKRNAPLQDISPADVPNALTWVRRMTL